MPDPTPIKALVLLSGSGTTFQNLYDKSQDGSCALEIKGVLSSRSGVYGLERARAVNVPTQVVDRQNYMNAKAFSQDVFRLVKGVNPDLIILAGFMSLLLLPDQYLGKVINIHPALLPDFGGKGMYGINVHRAVIEAGVQESGCTVHYVTNEYDAGPIILQRRISINPNETPEQLEERVQKIERETYPEAINMIAAGRVSFADGKAVFTE